MAFLKFLEKESSLIGAEISETSVKLIELISVNRQYLITTFAESAVNTSIKDAIQTALAQAKFKTRKVITAVPNSVVISKTISLDATLNEREIEQHISLEAERYFNCPANEIYWDFNRIDTAISASPKQQIYIVATRRKEVEMRVSALKAAGLKVKAVDLTSVALARVALLSTCNANSGLIYLDKQYLVLAILQEKKLIYAREAVINESSLDILQEVQQQLHLFMSSGASTQPVWPEEIWLAGNNKALEELSTLIKEQLKIKICLGNKPQIKIVAEENFNFNNFILSFGLALWDTNNEN